MKNIQKYLMVCKILILTVVDCDQMAEIRTNNVLYQ
jgi:hypothetical protein